MKPILTDLENLARAAGEILKSWYTPRPGLDRRLKVENKGLIDLVTEADHRSEAFLVGEIRQRFPTHRILAEESGSLAGDGDQLWLIDPLDGTVNFAHGVPIFSISIAYAEAGEVQLGVIYDPLRDECFAAEKRRGAWLNGQSIHCGGSPDLDHSLLVTGFPYDIRSHPDNNLGHYARLALSTQGVRRLGSAALDLGYVACGRFDGYWEIRLSPWDIAAGGLIAQEAGAVVTSTQGSTDYLTPPCSILAASPLIHAQVLAALGEASEAGKRSD